MTSTHTEHVAVGRLADQAEHTIRRLTHLTRPATGEPADPADAADIIAALAAMTVAFAVQLATGTSAF